MTAGRKLILGLVVIASAIGVVAYTGLRSAVVYYLTPTELLSRPDLRSAQLRIAGRVLPGSVQRVDGRVTGFRIADGGTALAVDYDGPLPDLFAEGREVLVEGQLSGAVLQATRVMTTHPAEYTEGRPKK